MSQLQDLKLCSSVGLRTRGPLGDIQTLSIRSCSKRAISRVQKGSPLRGLPNTT